VVVGALRPDDWDFPLLVHVLGAMLLVGTVCVVVAALVMAWRRREAEEAAPLRRLAFQALLFGVVPSYVLMRIGGQWLASEENLDETEPGWLDVGYVVADVSVLVLVATLVLAGLAVRRGARGGPLGRAAAVLSIVLLAGYLVAVWAMTAKPG
jgi:uncharacterized membrane protein